MNWPIYPLVTMPSSLKPGVDRTFTSGSAKCPNGPSVRFQLVNSHTMDELKMVGNCLKGSRPILCFDKTFDEKPHWKLIKELMTHVRFFSSVKYR